MDNVGKRTQKKKNKEIKKKQLQDIAQLCPIHPRTTFSFTLLYLTKRGNGSARVCVRRNSWKRHGGTGPCKRSLNSLSCLIAFLLFRECAFLILEREVGLPPLNSAHPPHQSSRPLTVIMAKQYFHFNYKCTQQNWINELLKQLWCITMYARLCVCMRVAYTYVWVLHAWVRMRMNEDKKQTKMEVVNIA